jgi:hypothetical protein
MNIRCYYEPSGANAMWFSVGPLETWWSYTTCVAFRVSGEMTVIHRNDWSATTGKHLNRIDDNHSHRVPSDEFRRLWGEQVVPILEAMEEARKVQQGIANDRAIVKSK